MYLEPIFIKDNRIGFIMKEITPSEAFSKIKPEMIVFVISIDKNHKPNGMVAARFLKCSRNPPLIAVSIGKQSNTYNLIKKSKEFVVAVANKNLLPYVDVFGKESGSNINKFEKTKIKTLPSKKIKTPLLKDASINLECKVEKEIAVGTSVLFIGKILFSHIDEDKKILFNFGKGQGEYLFKEV